VAVEPQVFDLLAYLIRERNRVVSRDDMIAAVWDGRIVSESALSARINAVRSAIGDNGEEQNLIKTFPRKGIRFVADVREQDGAVEAGAPGPAWQPALTIPDKPSIAVLPFTNMSGDPEQEYFADGMAEEILTALARCKWLFVIARNSSFVYKGKTVDIRQVGRDLGVRYVLEGSVRRGGNRLRFTGQLIDATTGSHIWADRFDGEMSDVFELQDRFTESIVAAIEPSLQRAEIERIKTKPAANLDAYDLLLHAQQLEDELTKQSLEAALGFLKKALALDPAYAPAMALAAYCHASRHSQGWSTDPEGEVKEGLRLAAKAVDLGKEDANVLWLCAFAVWRLATDAPRAKELASRALLLNPNSARALTILGWMEMVSGNSEKALEMFHRAERLSPRDPSGWLTATGFAHAYYIEDRYDEAAACAKRAVVQNPRFATALRFLAASLAKAGRREDAAEAVQQLLEMDPEMTLSKIRARQKHLSEPILNKYLDGLRMAGLPA
jgi:TolB-like protein/Tfp pilus assembly protein PilF